MFKIFCGLIYNKEEIYQKAISLLKEKFGKIDIETSAIPFDFTDYYQEEMGKDLKRGFISFISLQSPENSYKWKVLTIAIEKQLSLSGLRQINIDPGYITLSKVVLFSTKNYYHRIYLGEGVFAEVTLRWHNKQYEIFPWTYPDYKTDFAKNFFTEMRKIYSIQIKVHL
jgi:hypothetical protein